jgi:rubredoxin
MNAKYCPFCGQASKGDKVYECASCGLSYQIVLGRERETLVNELNRMGTKILEMKPGEKRARLEQAFDAAFDRFLDMEGV